MQQESTKWDIGVETIQFLAHGMLKLALLAVIGAVAAADYELDEGVIVGTDDNVPVRFAWLSLPFDHVWLLLSWQGKVTAFGVKQPSPSFGRASHYWMAVCICVCARAGPGLAV